ncbi:hypothetical protein HYV79_00630 [Candidatus Woesearchaeota archaeon]|nr:hypothetical protein [Candidatus Woesearchaeota archaeon]
MADEGKGLALAIFGIVAVIAIVGLVLLYAQARSVTGQGVSDYVGAFGRDSVRNLAWPGEGNPLWYQYGRDVPNEAQDFYYRAAFDPRWDNQGSAGAEVQAEPQGPSWR